MKESAPPIPEVKPLLCPLVGTKTPEDVETFAARLLEVIPSSDRLVLEYGCHQGQIVKKLLTARTDLEVVGIEDSDRTVDSALAFVNDPRFEVLLPRQLTRQVDFAFSIYSLHHIPAIDLRSALCRIHQSLRVGGLFVSCNADHRFASRNDRSEFFDDRFLGVSLRKEIERFFEPVAPLFSESMVAQSDFLRRRILGQGEAPPGRSLVAHPAIIYRRRSLTVPLYNA